MKKIVMCVAIALISACLFAGMDFRTSITGSFAVYGGHTAQSDEVVKSEYKMKSIGTGFCVTGVTPSLSYYAGLMGHIVPYLDMDDVHYHNYAEDSSFSGILWEFNAGVGKLIPITNELEAVAGLGVCLTHMKAQLDSPFLNVRQNHELTMLNLGLSAKCDFYYRFHPKTALILGIDAYAYMYNKTKSHTWILPPGWDGYFYNVHTEAKGWAMNTEIKASLGLATFF